MNIKGETYEYIASKAINIDFFVVNINYYKYELHFGDTITYDSVGNPLSYRDGIHFVVRWFLGKKTGFKDWWFGK